MKILQIIDYLSNKYNTVSNSLKKQPSSTHSKYYKPVIKKYKKQFQLDPNNGEILEKLALAKLNSLKYQKALTYLDILIEQHPQSSKHHFWRGLANFNLENHLEAHADYSMSLQLNENKKMEFQIFSQLSLCKFYLDDFDGGIYDLNQILNNCN